MDHVFFIHTSVNGHLGYFHALPIVSSAAVNIGVCIFFWTMFFSGCMPPKVGFLEPMIALFLVL